MRTLEDDFWSVRQHRLATLLKILAGVGIVGALIVCGFLATHPAASTLTHVVLSVVTGGVYTLVLGVVHGVKWLTAHWHAKPAPVVVLTPKPAVT